MDMGATAGKRENREFVSWAILAVAGLILLGGVIAIQSRKIAQRSASVVPPRPELGSLIFRRKGCANCHGSNAQGSDIAPSLRGKESLSSLPQLVTAMWNHAPRMWDAMDNRGLPYPDLSYQEMGELVSFLYFSRYADDSGDPTRGAKVFREKQCIRCHSVKGEGGKLGPDLSSGRSAETPIEWTQALWNHSAKMQTEMQRMKISWPAFQPKEMADLFAYVRRATGHTDGEFPFPASDPENGWEVFQNKGCIRCHSLSQNSSDAGVALGPNRPLPASFSEFGADMVNHFPKMQQTMTSQGGSVPEFQGTEMSDLVGFIYSLHYVEPSGSLPVGASVFKWRGCADCHGTQAEGTRSAPALRGTGQNYTANRLATDLWRHGARMYKQNNRFKRNWPMLQDSDIGDLLTFLNSPPEPN
jgi:mono/diheme cytochrome c family protein